MVRLAAMVPALLMLSACAEPLDLAIHDYRQRFPLQVESRDAVAVVALGETGLTGDDRAALSDLAGLHRKRGAGPVVVRAVAPAEADRAAAHLAGLGIDPKSIIVEIAGNAPGLGPDKAEVRVPLWSAVVPGCGTFEKGVQPDWDNAPNSNFGCSIQRNIGLMVSNPADLVRAREPSGRDGTRSADVLDKYGKGQATGSVREGASTLSTVGGTAGGATAK